MAITLLEDIVNRFIVNSPADHTVEEYSGNTNVSAINSVLVYSRKENVKVFARVTATQVWETLGVVGNDLDAVSGHGTEYRKDAVFNVTTMDRVSIISLGAETTARIVFNPSLPTEALSNATPSGGSTTSQTIVSDMAQNQITTLAIASGTTPIIQIFEDTVIPGAGSTELDVLRLHLDSNLTDSSDSGHTVTAHGNAAVSTSEKKFGAGSAYFDGSGDYLSIADSDDWNLIGDITTPYTIEMWIKFDSAPTTDQMLVGHYEGLGDYWVFYYSGPSNGIHFRSRSGGTLNYAETGANITDAAWHHVALVKEGNTGKIYVDGVGSSAITFSATDTYAGSLGIGRVYEPWNQDLAGHIDDIRITKGLARYTANFAVPTEAHPDTNAADTTETTNKTSDFKIHHASDTSVKITKLTAGSADAKIRLI